MLVVLWKGTNRNSSTIPATAVAPTVAYKKYIITMVSMGATKSWRRCMAAKSKRLTSFDRRLMMVPTFDAAAAFLLIFNAVR